MRELWVRAGLFAEGPTDYRFLLPLLGHGRRRPLDSYDFFGKNIALDALRRLPAFVRFEAELLAAVHQLAASGASGS